MLLTTEVNNRKMHMKTYSKRELLSDNPLKLMAVNWQTAGWKGGEYDANSSL
jgi:hypothetical protein